MMTVSIVADGYVGYMCLMEGAAPVNASLVTGYRYTDDYCLELFYKILENDGAYLMVSYLYQHAIHVSVEPPYIA